MLWCDAERETGGEWDVEKERGKWGSSDPVRVWCGDAARLGWARMMADGRCVPVALSLLCSLAGLNA